MKKMKSIALVAIMLLIGFANVNAANSKKSDAKTAETVLALANSFDELTPENSAILRAEIKSLSLGERIQLAKLSYKMAKEANESKVTTEKAKPGLYILAIFLPPVAVGIHTDWTKPTAFNLLWTLVGGLPGIIHAFIVLGR